jgi:hypothetical protein
MGPVVIVGGAYFIIHFHRFLFLLTSSSFEHYNPGYLYLVEKTNPPSLPDTHQQ